METAYQDDSGGFPDWKSLKLGRCTKSFVIWIPSKRDFVTKTSEAVGFFHDGKAAFHLQAGIWVLGVGRMYAADKQGLPDAKLGWFFFPEFRVARVRLMTSLAAYTAG